MVNIRVGLIFTCLFSAFLSYPAYSDERPLVRSEIIPPAPKLELTSHGSRKPIKYKKYGKFKHIGTEKYRYNMKAKTELSDVAGEGVFPNQNVFKNPQYLELKKQKKLD